MTTTTATRRSPARAQWARPGIATIAAIAVIGSVFTSLPASADTEPVSLSPVADAVDYQALVRVPALDSQVGAGNRLSTDPGSVIPLGIQVPDGHGSALVHIAILDAREQTDVWAVGTPALTVPADSSASTTLLLPVVDEGISLWASDEVDARIELLATFDADPTVPGATIALTEPVTRANTDAGLAGDLLTSDPIRVGLVGDGDLPSTGVRAVYATVTVDAASSTILHLGDQAVPVPAGTLSVTTVLVPDEHGGVKLSLDSGTASLRLDVRGWIPESVQNTERVNATGSYVPRVSATSTTAVRSNEPAEAALGQVEDGDFVIALVSAEPAGSTTLLDLGAPYQGRGRGAVLDAETGAQPQLALASVAEGPATLNLRQGTSAVSVTPLGVLLNAQPSRASAPSVEIASHDGGESVNLGDGGAVSLSGTIEAGGRDIDSITVTANGQSIGSASVRYYADGAVTWAFDTGVPDDGEYRFEVTATDRSGRTGSTALTLNAHLPDVSETVITPETVVIPDAGPGGATVVSDLTDEQVVFTEEPDFSPGSVIVGGPTEGAPEGFLRRVESVDFVEGAGWVVATSSAALTDVFVQVDEDDQVDLLAAGDVVISEDVDPDTDDNTDIEIIDEGEAAVHLLTGDDVDVEPYPESEGAADAFTVEPTSFGVDQSLTSSLKVGTELRFATGGSTQDVSKASQAIKQASRTQIQAQGGVAVSLEAELSVRLNVAMRISVVWNWLPTVNVDRFDVIATATSKTTAQLEAFLQASTTRTYSAKYADVRLRVPPLMIGAVPVVITPRLTLSTQTQFTMEASVRTELGIQHEQRYGFRYSNSQGFQGVNEESSTYTTPVFGRYGNAEVTGSIEATFGPRLGVEISIYDAAGPVFTLGASAGVEAEVTISEAGPSVEVTLFLEASVSGSVQLRVPIIDMIALTYELFRATLRFNLSVWEWGLEDAFPVVDPGPDPGLDPVGEPVATVTAGFGKSLVVTTAGKVYTWGENWAGQLGDGTTQDRWSPVHIEGLNNITEIAAGGHHSVALTATGEVYAWGLNTGGQLGDGTQQGRLTPVLIEGLNNVTAIAAGLHHSLALTTTGEVYAWGENWVGQLGDGTTENRWSPVHIEGLNNITEIAAGDEHSLAVSTSGDVYAWGDNEYGQLGDGTREDRWSPVRVEGLNNVTAIAATYLHSLAVTSTGEVYAWGDNNSGQLGDGTREDRWSPVRVEGLNNVTAIAAGFHHSLAITSTGEVHAWGNGWWGQLGNGSQQGRSFPAPIAGLSSAAAIAAGHSHSLAVTAAGELHAWGNNGSGQLGDGTTEDRWSPVRIIVVAGDTATADVVA